MKLTIVNNSLVPIAAAGHVTVPAGESIEQEGRTQAEYASLVSRYASDDVQIHAELEAADFQPVYCNMKTPADPAGGVDSLAAVGFDIETYDGNAAAITDQMYFAVFSDAACTTLSTTATLDTAATGTIDSGAGTACLLVTPDGGELSVTVSDTEDEAVYLKAWAVGTGRAMDTSDVHTVTFTAA